MNKRYQWEIRFAVLLTSLGVLYYLVFLFYFSGGVPIERIHEHLTDGWPELLADYVPYIAPIFLLVGLWLGYSYNEKRNPKAPAVIPDENYKFEFNRVPQSKFSFQNKNRRKMSEKS